MAPGKKPGQALVLPAFLYAAVCEAMTEPAAEVGFRWRFVEVECSPVCHSLNIQSQ